MARKELTPTVVSYSAAMSASEKGKQWEVALALLQEMVRKELMPDVVSYSAAMSACEKGAHARRASSGKEPWHCCRRWSARG